MQIGYRMVPTAPLPSQKPFCSGRVPIHTTPHHSRRATPLKHHVQAAVLLHHKEKFLLSWLRVGSILLQVAVGHPAAVYPSHLTGLSLPPLLQHRQTFGAWPQLVLSHQSATLRAGWAARSARPVQSGNVEPRYRGPTQCPGTTLPRQWPADLIRAETGSTGHQFF